MSAKAQAEKDKGNEAFKAGDFPRAIGHYTAAFIADPSNPTYPLNRAAAYLKLGKNEDAERDCDSVLKLDAKNVKGLFRRGQARVALQKLREAEGDFSRVLELDPANQAAKQELKKVQDALKAILPKPKQRAPIDISPKSQSPTPVSPPVRKRRRIPIEIVEPGAASASETLLRPVSSRPIAAQPAPSIAPPAPKTEPQPVSSPSSAPPRQPPQTFREAKTARDESRPRGGIFRADGTQKMFAAGSSSRTGATGSASPPKRDPPQTLVAFMNLWRSLTTEEERWEVLRQIPATRLPLLFKTSLDASILSAILRSLRTALALAPEDEERLRVVRAYMVNLPRVPRFATVSLMMSDEERSDAQVIWDLLGRYQGDGIDGQMEKRKEEGSKSAWGCS